MNMMKPGGTEVFSRKEFLAMMEVVNTISYHLTETNFYKGTWVNKTPEGAYVLAETPDSYQHLDNAVERAAYFFVETQKLMKGKDRYWMRVELPK